MIQSIIFIFNGINFYFHYFVKGKKFKMNNNSLHQLQPLLCDPYRIGTVYSYWKMQNGSSSSSGEDKAVFELYSVDNPSDAKFAVFAGIEKFLEGLEHFEFDDDGMNYDSLKM